MTTRKMAVNKHIQPNCDSLNIFNFVTTWYVHINEMNMKHAYPVAEPLKNIGTPPISNQYALCMILVTSKNKIKDRAKHMKRPKALGFTKIETLRNPDWLNRELISLKKDHSMIETTHPKNTTYFKIWTNSFRVKFR
tara:strand:- start:6779 stop:7189 length:411 start_codon:yes stop_codon:yes gene_type:complete